MWSICASPSVLNWSTSPRCGERPTVVNHSARGFGTPGRPNGPSCVPARGTAGSGRWRVTRFYIDRAPETIVGYLWCNFCVFLKLCSSMFLAASTRQMGGVSIICCIAQKMMSFGGCRNVYGVSCFRLGRCHLLVGWGQQLRNSTSMYYDVYRGLQEGRGGASIPYTLL